MNETITCPSGLTGTIRSLKAGEFNILADKRLAKRGGQIDKLLQSCWIETLDPGPYDFGEGSVDWKQVLQGDRFYALLRIRACSLGNEYAFRTSCTQDSCRANFDWELSLEDLPVKSLDAHHRSCFEHGNRFECVLPSGTKVWFRLAVGADEQRAAKIAQANPDRMYTSMLQLRIDEIDGVKPSEKKRFIEDLDLSDAEFLRAQFEEVDCGVETTIEIECPECMSTQEVELPLGRNFFLPETRSRSGSKLRGSGGSSQR